MNINWDKAQKVFDADESTAESAEAKATVLVVDDEAPNLTLYKAALEPRFKILTAASGEQALSIIQETDVHVVVTDHRMPKMTGMQLCRELKRRQHSAPRIIITGYADLQGVISAVNEYGAAWTTQDADRIAALFTEDAVYVERAFDRNGTFVGREQIREYWLRQICGKQTSIRFRHVERDLVIDSTRPVAVVKWLAEFDNFREKRADKAEKLVRFCQVARLEFRGEQICYLEEYGQSVSGPGARWPPLDASEDELAARIRKRFKESAVAATCDKCQTPFASRSKLFAHLRATPCGEGVVSRPAVEPTAALCFTVSYDAPPRLQEVLHHVVGQHGHLNWAVPLRVAPAAMCNRVAINVPKRILADLPSLVRRLRERLPDVDVQGADVADRPFAAERRQAERYIALHRACPVEVLRRATGGITGVSRADGVRGTRRLSHAVRVA